jgi:hypothetical protein
MGKKEREEFSKEEVRRMDKAVRESLGKEKSGSCCIC